MAAIHFTNEGKRLDLDVYEDIFASIDARIHFREEDVVLEVGAGSGLLTERIAARCSRVVATDISDDMLRLIPQRDNLVTVAQQSDALTFSNATFDKVVCYSVAQYFPDLSYFERVFKEQMRVLKPGGALFLGDLFNGYLERAFREMERRTQPFSVRVKRMVKRQVYGRGSYLFLRPDYIEQLARSAGCREVHCFLQTSGRKPELHRQYRFDAAITK